MYTRLAIPVVIGLASVVFYILASPVLLANIPVKIEEFYAEQFFSVLATLYAIITALVLVKGIETFDALNTAINNEASLVRSIKGFLPYFHGESDQNNEIVSKIRNCLSSYVSIVLKQEKVLGSEKNAETIRECTNFCSKLDCQDENDRIALGEIMRGFSSLGALRAERMNCARAKIPNYLLVMLAMMTVTIVFPFFLENPANSSLLNFNIYIIFTLTMFGSFILILLIDINHPFDGLWKIDMSPFELLLLEFEN